MNGFISNVCVRGIQSGQQISDIFNLFAVQIASAEEPYILEGFQLPVIEGQGEQFLIWLEWSRLDGRITKSSSRSELGQLEVRHCSAPRTVSSPRPMMSPWFIIFSSRSGDNCRNPVRWTLLSSNTPARATFWSFHREWRTFAFIIERRPLYTMSSVEFIPRNWVAGREKMPKIDSKYCFLSPTQWKKVNEKSQLSRIYRSSTYVFNVTPDHVYSYPGRRVISIIFHIKTGKKNGVGTWFSWPINESI